MYGLYGFSHNIQNIYKLAAPFLEADKIETTDDLKIPYRKFLAGLHTDMPLRQRSGKIVIDKDEATTLAKAFSVSSLNDLGQEYMINESQMPSSQLQSSAERHLCLLQRLQPELAQLFDLAIHSIILRGSHCNKAGLSAHGGTSNRCIGLMWLTLKPTISTQDLLEMFIHELTHTLVFLDELNFEHFDYQHIIDQKYWATSAILNRPRPMDKVLHSILVSCELLHARKTFLPGVDTLSVHPPSDVIHKSTIGAIDSVLNQPYLHKTCKPRAVELIESARHYLELNYV